MSQTQFIHHGLFPGTEPDGYYREQLESCESVPLTLVTQPERGPGSDMVGRSLAWLRGLPVELQPYGWRLSQKAGIDQRRIDAALHTDLGALADVLSATGAEKLGALKVQSFGPFSLAASVHLPSGEKAISDSGAVDEIATEQAHVTAEQLYKLAGEYGVTELYLEIFEHQIGNVLTGAIPTASGFERYRALDAELVDRHWSTFNQVLTASAESDQGLQIKTVLNLAGSSSWTKRVSMLPQEPAETGWRFDAATGARFAELTKLADQAGFSGIYVPHQLSPQDWEHIAQWLEADKHVLLGAPIGPTSTDISSVATELTERWRQQGLPASRLGQAHVASMAEMQNLNHAAHQSVIRNGINLTDALQQLSADGF